MPLEAMEQSHEAALSRFCSHESQSLRRRARRTGRASRPGGTNVRASA